jgi:protein-L-isoaspartate(D-aspartate) O-methyltransferase
VIPVGEVAGMQHLVRVTRVAAERFEEERLTEVRFVPLVGAEGWRGDAKDAAPGAQPAPPRASGLPALIAKLAEPFAEIDGMDLAPLLARIGDARVVLLGEASHGTSEFYAMRTAITRA